MTTLLPQVSDLFGNLIGSYEELILDELSQPKVLIGDALAVCIIIDATEIGNFWSVQDDRKLGEFLEDVCTLWLAFLGTQD